MVTGVRHNEQPGDLEAREGAHVTGFSLFLLFSTLYDNSEDVKTLK